MENNKNEQKMIEDLDFIPVGAGEFVRIDAIESFSMVGGVIISVETATRSYLIKNTDLMKFVTQVIQTKFLAPRLISKEEIEQLESISEELPKEELPEDKPKELKAKRKIFNPSEIE